MNIQINEKKGNLFDLPKDKYVFGHCIATDLKWGAGIAPIMMKEFNASERWRKTANQQIFKVGEIGVDESSVGTMVNLFTKSSTFGKPTYESLTRCLVNLREWMLANGRHYLAIPRIGCGLDGLLWSQVSQLLRLTFLETDIEIEVRYI